MAKRRTSAVTAGALAVLALPAWGGDWDLAAQVRANVSWTDNLYLSATDPEGAGVLNVTPYLSARRAGARVRAEASYRLQQYLYTEGLDQSSTYHQFQGRVQSELVRERLFLDVDAGYGQVLVDPDRAISTGNMALSGNRANVATFSAVPYVPFRVGDLVQGRLTYGYRGVRASGGRVDSDGTHAGISLSSARQGARLGWTLGWQHRDERYSSRPRFEREVVSLDVRYRLTGKLALVAGGGREDNSYQRAVGSRVPRGTFWNAGVQWRPSRRTSAEVRIGRRFFGRTASAELQHRLRRVVLSATYVESLRTFQQVVLERQLFVLTDPFGRPVLDDATGLPVVIEISYPALASGVYLSRRATVNWAYTRGRSTYQVSLYQMRREYQGTLRKERLRGLRASWQWELGRRTGWWLSGLVQTRDRLGGAGTDDYWSVTAGLRRRLQPDLQATVSARRTVRDGTSGIRTYDQTVLTVGLTASF